MSDIVWGDYTRAYKAIFDAVQSITSLVTEVSKLDFEWNADGTLATLKAYKGSDLLYTLTFSWNADGTLQSISRS